jgi:hypothetical protein
VSQSIAEVWVLKFSLVKLGFIGEMTLEARN